MRAGLSALVLRNLRTCSELRVVNRKGPMTLLPSQQYSQRAEDSSTSNWGTGEPPIDETQTQRGVSPGQPTASGSAPSESTGGESSEPTSTSGFDAGKVKGEQEVKQGPKKSRTGGDMSDDGQVQTPNLNKMRSTRDMINSKGNQTQDRLAGKKSS